MLNLIKIIILLFILFTNALILSAEEISEISEQTFIDKIMDHAPSEENELKSSTPKVGLFSPIASVKKYPGSLVLSLKDAIIRTLSNNISIQVESFNNKVKKESVAESLSEFDATLGLVINREKNSTTSERFQFP